MRLAMLAMIAGLGLAGTVAADSPPPIKMNATPLGSGQVTVNWSDYAGNPGAADTATVNVLRDGAVIAQAPNPLPIPLLGNSYTLTGQPAGSHSFQVCEHLNRTALGWDDEPPALCSNVVTRTVT